MSQESKKQSKSDTKKEMKQAPAKQIIEHMASHELVKPSQVDDQDDVPIKSTQNLSPTKDVPQKVERRVQIMIPSQADPSEILNQSEDMNQKASITPSVKNLASGGKASPKPIVPIIKIPSRSSGVGQPLISSDRNMRGEDAIQEQAPTAELEGGAKSKRSFKSKASSKHAAGTSREEMDYDDEEEEEEEEESGGSGPDPASQPEDQAQSPARPAQEGEQDEDEDEDDDESDAKPPAPPKKKESKTRADEDEDSDDKDSGDDSDDSESSLGIDLSNYYTKEEADKILKDQIKSMQTNLQNEYTKLIKD